MTKILTYTTQDQVSFPYVVQKSGILPLTFPATLPCNLKDGCGEEGLDHGRKVEGTYHANDFFVKLNHGI